MLFDAAISLPGIYSNGIILQACKDPPIRHASHPVISNSKDLEENQDISHYTLVRQIIVYLHCRRGYVVK